MDNNYDVSEAGGAVTPTDEEMKEETRNNDGDNEQQLDDLPPDLMDPNEYDDSDNESSYQDEEDYVATNELEQYEPSVNIDTHDMQQPLRVRRNSRQRNQPDRLTVRAFAADVPNFSWMPEDITSHIEHAYQAEVENSIDINKVDPGSVLPAPGNCSVCDP
jgi:hypothetical protein